MKRLPVSSLKAGDDLGSGRVVSFVMEVEASHRIRKQLGDPALFVVGLVGSDRKPMLLPGRVIFMVERAGDKKRDRNAVRPDELMEDMK